MDCLIAMCHVLSLVIFVTSCEQFIGERYAGPGRGMGREGNEELELELELERTPGHWGEQPAVTWGPVCGRSGARVRQHKRITTITST